VPTPHSFAAAADFKDLVHVVAADGGDGEEVAAVVKLVPEDAAVAYAVADVGAEVVGALLAAEGGVEGGVDGELDEIPGVGVDVGFLQPDGDGSAVDEEVSGVTAEADDVDVAYCGVHFALLFALPRRRSVGLIFLWGTGSANRAVAYRRCQRPFLVDIL